MPSDRARAFVHHFLSGRRGIRGNRRKAALAAGYPDTTSLDVTISELAKTDFVKKAIEAHWERWDITDARIIAEYCRIAFANIADVIEKNEDGDFVVDAKTLEDLGDEITSAIAEIKPVIGSDGTTRYAIKMHDKKGALDMLVKLRNLVKSPEINVTLIQLMANMNLSLYTTDELRQFRELLVRGLPPGMFQDDPTPKPVSGQVLDRRPAPPPPDFPTNGTSH